MQDSKGRRSGKKGSNEAELGEKAVGQQLDAIRSEILSMDEETLIRFQTELQYAVKYHEHAYNAAQRCILNAKDEEHPKNVGAFAGIRSHPRRVIELLDSALYVFAREALSKMTGRAMAARWAGWICFEDTSKVKDINTALETIMRRRYPYGVPPATPEALAEETFRSIATVELLGVKGFFLEGDLNETFAENFMRKQKQAA
jgi:hypothetical protein